MDAMGHVSAAMSQFQNLKQKLLVNTTNIQVPMSKLKENTHILVIPTNNPHLTLQPLIRPTYSKASSLKIGVLHRLHGRVSSLNLLSIALVKLNLSL